MLKDGSLKRAIEANAELALLRRQFQDARRQADEANKTLGEAIFAQIGAGLEITPHVHAEKSLIDLGRHFAYAFHCNNMESQYPEQD